MSVKMQPVIANVSMVNAYRKATLEYVMRIVVVMLRVIVAFLAVCLSCDQINHHVVIVASEAEKIHFSKRKYYYKFLINFFRISASIIFFIYYYKRTNSFFLLSGVIYALIFISYKSRFLIYNNA